MEINNDSSAKGVVSQFTIGDLSASSANLAQYKEDLTEFELNEAQIDELLQTLWSIMRRFVEMGFDVDILGQFIEAASGEDSAAVE